MATPVWAELHVDDRLPGALSALPALLTTLAAGAEARGARLSLRLRAEGARACRGGLLPALVAAGHEVGVHAHGRGLGAAVEALRSAGVSPTIGAPGLLQAGPAGRAGLLAQARALGLRQITDLGPQRCFVDEGLHPRWEEGLLVRAPAVRPEDWGLYDAQGAPGPLDRAFARLRRCEAQVQGRAASFGFTLHEHDLTEPGGLRPRAAALDALFDYLDGRVVTAGSLPLPPPTGGRQTPPPTDGALRLRRLAHRAAAPLREAGPRARDRLRRALPGPPFERLDVAGRRIAWSRLGPAAARALVLVSAGGLLGGRRLGLRPLGISPTDLAQMGLATVLFDRSGTGDSAPGPAFDPRPGGPEACADWAALLHEARSEGRPILALSWSSGLVPVLQAAARGHRPDALLDVEGPADRFSLQAPARWPLPSPFSDHPWEELEPVALIGRLRVPYRRLQGDPDHVHGSYTDHARRLLEAATGPVAYDALPGPLSEHPQRILQAIVRAIEALGAG